MNSVRFTVIAAAALAFATGPAQAQFVTPTSAPLSVEFGRTGSMRRAIAGYVKTVRTACDSVPEVAAATDKLLKREARRDCRIKSNYLDELQKRMKTYCRLEYYEDERQGKQLVQCLADAANDTLANKILRAGDASPTRIIIPFLRGRSGLVEAFQDRDKFDVLRQFAANVGDDQIFVLTDIVSGAIGAVPFGVSTAAIVTKDDSDTTSSMIVVEGLTSDLTRLVNNGGSVSGRLVLLTLSTRAPSTRIAASLSGQIGLLGNLGEPDSLAASGTVVKEGVFSFALREPTAEAKRIGDVHVGIRLGWAWKDSALAPDLIDHKSFWFFQAGVAIAKVSGDSDGSGELSLGALVTIPFDAAVRDRIPTFMINLNAKP